MKIISNIHFIIFSCILVFFESCVNDDVNYNKISIAKFPENKVSAISFTFDDGYPSGYNIIAPIFEEYNYRASFFLIAGNINSEEIWNTWKNLSLKGFEIGNHSFSHQNLRDIMDTTTLKKEIFDSYDLLSEKIGKPPFTFVHPFHTTNPIANAFIFSRHYASRLAPKGFCKWEAWPSEVSEKYIKKIINESINKGLWYVPCAHGIGDGWGPIPEDLLRNILNYVKLNESKIHLDTFENIAKYILERENSQLIVSDAENGKTIELRSNLDTKIFDLPLLIVVYGRGDSFLKITPLHGKIFSKTVGKDLFIYIKPNSIFVME